MATELNVQKILLDQKTKTYADYYNGKMSYRLHGRSWEKYVRKEFPELENQNTSENIFKDVVDLFAQQVMPQGEGLAGFAKSVVPLLIRGEAVVIVAPDGAVTYPQHYEVLSDGELTVALIYTRSLVKMEDYAIFVYSDGHAELTAKPVPDDLSDPDSDGYQPVETTYGWSLFHFTLTDRGMGASLASLQDRVNHSVLDQTVIAEMYARPFWYLLNTEVPISNPYMPTPEDNRPIKQHDTDGAAGRVFVTNSGGPFGQLTPPTITDMVAYHDSIITKVSQSTGVPEFFLRPGGTVPSGVALKVLSSRFNGRVNSMRNSIKATLVQLAERIGMTKEGDEFDFWPDGNDLLQDSIDLHGISLKQMGYPLSYVATVVTPGIDLDDYTTDGNEPTDDDPFFGEEV